MSNGIYCRKCLGSYSNKKEYEKHTCDLAPKEEFKVLQLAKNCYYIRDIRKGDTQFMTVGTPLMATHLGEHYNKELLFKEVEHIFPNAKVVCVKVNYEMKDD